MLLLFTTLEVAIFSKEWGVLHLDEDKAVVDTISDDGEILSVENWDSSTTRHGAAVLYAGKCKLLNISLNDNIDSCIWKIVYDGQYS
jgi:hypothetical protein